MRVYCAGPMRGYEKFNFPMFDAARDYLKALGHEVISPADLDRDVGVNENTLVLPDGFIYEAMRRDFLAITTCDAIAFLPGWESSSGSKAERFVAEQCGLAIYHVDPWVSFTREQAPILVGISGYAQAGKDTTGAILVEDFGFTRLAFADALKNFTSLTHPHVAKLVEAEGWEAAKRNPEVRSLLQRAGVAARDAIGPDVWIDAALRHVQPGGAYVVCDCRFPNEAFAIKSKGGFLVRIERPGTGPVNAHVSETALDGYEFDAVIRNDGDLAELRQRVRLFAISIPEAA